MSTPEAEAVAAAAAAALKLNQDAESALLAAANLMHAFRMRGVTPRTEVIDAAKNLAGAIGKFVDAVPK